MKTRNLIRALLASVLLMLLGACNYEDLTQGMISKLVPEDALAFSQAYLQHVHDGDLVYMKRYLDGELQAKINDEELLKVSGYFPKGQLASRKIIGVNVHQVNAQWQANLTYEYQFADGWAVASVLLARAQEGFSVLGVHVYRTPASQGEINRLTLAGKTPLHYLVLALAAGAAALTLVSAVVCFRTPIPRRKWLWVLFVLVGFCSFHINWTTGQWEFMPVVVQLFSASALAAGPYSPWFISFSFPLGAIVFWARRKSFVRASAAKEQGEALA
jgi:hypothetical protein